MEDLDESVCWFAECLARGEDPRKTDDWGKMDVGKKKAILQAYTGGPMLIKIAPAPIFSDAGFKERTEREFQPRGISSLDIPSVQVYNLSQEPPLPVASSRVVMANLPAGERSRRKRMVVSSTESYEVSRISRMLSNGAAASGLDDASTQSALPPAVTEHVEQYVALLMREQTPLGSVFNVAVRQMMHSFGDVCLPCATSAAALEYDTLMYTKRVVATLRSLCACDLPSRALTLADLTKMMPNTLAAYSRWKMLKKKTDVSTGDDDPFDGYASGSGSASDCTSESSDGHLSDLLSWEGTETCDQSKNHPHHAKFKDTSSFGQAASSGKKRLRSDNVEEGLSLSSGSSEALCSLAATGSGNAQTSESVLLDDAGGVELTSACQYTIAAAVGVSITGSIDHDDSTVRVSPKAMVAAVDKTYDDCRVSKASGSDTSAIRASSTFAGSILRGDPVPVHRNSKVFKIGKARLSPAERSNLAAGVMRAAASKPDSEQPRDPRSLGATGAATAANIQQPAIQPEPHLASFFARLAFFNARSARLSNIQYAIYARAREVGFTSSVALERKFIAECGLGPSILAASAVEAIGYLSFDRIGCAVEGARHLFEAANLHDSLTHDEIPIPLAVYIAAVAELPLLPSELAAAVESAAQVTKREAELRTLAALRAQRTVKRR